MCKNLKLYDHTEDIYNKWVDIYESEKDVLIILGCGLGKTGIAAKIIQNHFIDKPVLYVLPTNSIEDDIIHKDFWNFKNVKFIRYHSLQRYNPNEYSLCIFDEGHHIAAPKWVTQFNRFKESSCYTLTMTATDYRLDGILLRRDIFNENNTIVGMSMFDAIALNKIKKPQYISSLLNPDESSEIVLSYAHKAKATSNNMKKLSDSFQTMMKFDEILKKYTLNKRRILAYVSKIEDVDIYYDKLADVYPDALIFKIHSKLPKKYITESLRIFNSDIDKQVILVSINMLNEGIHPKDIDCLLITRDTSSIIMYMQQIGRIVDLNKPDKDALIIDFIETHKRSRYMKLSALLDSPDNNQSDTIVNGPKTIRDVKERVFNIIGDYYMDILDIIQNNINPIIWTEEILSKLGNIYDSDISRIYGIPTTTVGKKRKELGIPKYDPYQDRWTEEILSKLGKVHDKYISETYGIPADKVSMKRKELGIPVFYSSTDRINWTEEMISKLGTMPDREVAKLYGIHPTSVSSKRNMLGIHQYRVTNDIWTDENISKLGTMPDNDLANLIGVSSPTIFSKRKELGIEAYNPYDVHWTEEMISKLGTMPDTEVAKLYEISTHSVGYKRNMLGIAPFIPYSDWTEEMVSKLGTMADSHVAKLYNLSTTSVGKKRNGLGIPPYKSRTNWTNEMISQLGTISDAALGDIYGITESSVARKRKELGIAAFGSCDNWTEEMISKLGTMPDTEVGKLYDLHGSTVSLKRRQLGIPSYSIRNREWTNEMISQLGTMYDGKFAKLYNKSNNAVFKKRKELGIPAYNPSKFNWTEEMISKLGTMPDSQLAKLYDLSAHSVFEKRVRMGISVYNPRKSSSWTEEMISKLGTMPDSQLAKLYNVSIQTVGRKRKLLGIPTYRSGKNET